MFELLYAVNAVFKAFGLPGFCAFSMAIEWHMARWLSLYTADDIGCDKSSAMALKNAQPIPGAYRDEILLLCATPHPHTPSIAKLSLPGSRIPIMPCIEICASPIRDDGGALLAQGSFENPQNGDTVGYLSDDDVRFSVQFFQGTDMLIHYFRIC